jgi:phage-related protein
MSLPKLSVRFFRTEAGNEPVRERLKELPQADRKTIGDEIRIVQFGWPIGMPLVRKLRPGLWEVRVNLDSRIARVIFTTCDGDGVLLHGFIKKSPRTPESEPQTAIERLKLLSTAQKRAKHPRRD